MALLSINNLQVEFTTSAGKVTGVEDVSFEIKAGEIVGVVGESGSGKSVTSLAIMRLLATNANINSGNILFRKNPEEIVDITDTNDQDIDLLRGKRMGMVFQEPMSSLNPTMRCGEQVEEALRMHLGLKGAPAKDKVLHLFKQVKLIDIERIYNSYPHEISGGQKQRVMIAMAVSCDPELLIADEPTTALDVTVQRGILRLIKELRDTIGCAVLFITHDLGVVAEIADRIVVMQNGRVVEEGDVHQIFKQPNHLYTKSLLACRPPLDQKINRLPTIEDIQNETKKSHNVLTEEEIENRNQLLYSKAPILEVNNLSVWFPKKKNWYGRTTAYVKAVDDVSFKIYPGETLGLVGESGCGKTSLSRALLRLISSHSGEVLFQGKNVMNFDSAELKAWRKDFQIVFQDPYSALNPKMRIGEAIKEPMDVHGILNNDNDRKLRAIELLEKVGLKAEHYARYPHEFSGGQKQRICIARALALNPKFIICDESVSALDVSIQAQVLNLLLDLQEELGLTYIFISHDLSIIRLMSDRILIMQEGKIIERAKTEELYKSPKKQYTKKLLEAIPTGF